MTCHRIKSKLTLSIGLAVLIFSVMSFGKQVLAITETGPTESKGVEILPEIAEGLPIALVYVHLGKSTGDLQRDEEFKKQVTEAFAFRAGGLFKRFVVEMGLKKVQKLASVQSAEYKVYEAVPSGQIVVVIFATPVPEKDKIPKKPSGMVLSKRIQEFPTIFEDDSSKLVFILNGGTGIYSDINPWFGGHGEVFNRNSPIAKDPLNRASSAWIEGYVEPGLGGIVQLGEFPIYPYGAITYLMSGTAGHDIYNSGAWGHGEFEKL